MKSSGNYTSTHPHVGRLISPEINVSVGTPDSGRLWQRSVLGVRCGQGLRNVRVLKGWREWGNVNNHMFDTKKVMFS